MADITQDSYDEALRFFKVMFQRGKEIRDSELNEFQDILRFMFIRCIANGVQRTKNNTLNPGSNDDGYLVVGTSANNQVTLKGGTLFCDGLPIFQDGDTTLSGFTTPGSNRTDTVYLAITEAEVADPSAVPQLGETTRRRQVQVTVNISTTGHAGVPSNTVAEIFEGGTHYFMIADIARTSGQAAINPGDVTDLRALLPPQYIEDLQDPAKPGDSLVASAEKGAHPEYVLAEGTVASQLDALRGLINGSFDHREVSANDACDSDSFRDDLILITAASITFGLPDPADNAGRRLHFADKSGALSPGAPFTLTRFGTELIDGIAADYNLITPGGRWMLTCDGTDWYLFSC